MSLLITLLISPFTRAEEISAQSRKAISSDLGPQSFLLGIAHAGKRLVSVGERGLILYSDDNGQIWRQASVPVSVTLTSVQFANADTGYAIGHSGSVLSTTDGGENWELRLDGQSIAQIALKAAREADDDDLITAAERLVTEGPDKPLLDLLVVDSQQVFVVGAYGFLLKSLDGGQTWLSLMDRVENIFGSHIYAIRQRDNRITMAGEMGAFWLSRDYGESFELLETPYEGSFFTVELIGNEEIVLAGLRGNVWRSLDNGTSWDQIPTANEATINASMLTSDGELLLLNQAGMVLRLDNDQLVMATSKRFPPLHGIVELDNSGYLMVSQRGIVSAEAKDLQ